MLARFVRFRYNGTPDPVPAGRGVPLAYTPTVNMSTLDNPDRLRYGRHMTVSTDPNTDLPALPETQRWFIREYENEFFKESDVLEIALEEQYTTIIFRNVRWRTLARTTVRINETTPVETTLRAGAMVILNIRSKEENLRRYTGAYPPKTLDTPQEP